MAGTFSLTGGIQQNDRAPQQSRLRADSTHHAYHLANLLLRSLIPPLLQTQLSIMPQQGISLSSIKGSRAANMGRREESDAQKKKAEEADAEGEGQAGQGG